MKLLRSILLAGIFYGLLSSASLAARIEILSGEHADFSRLVVQLPVGTDWEFGREGDTYIFRPLKFEAEFDISGVFERIPKKRIQLVSQEGHTIRISTRAGFHADVFELRAGRVVIDIKDGQAPIGSIFEKPITASLEVPAHSPEIAELREISISTENSTELPGNSEKPSHPQIRTTPNLFPIVFNDEQPVQVENPASSNEVSRTKNEDPTETRAAQLQAQILDQIGRAVSQGLLEPNTEQTDRTVERLDKLTSSSSEPLSEAKTKEAMSRSMDHTDSPPKADKSHIKIQTSVDRESRAPSQSLSTDELGHVCLDNSDVEIAEWGSPLEDGLEIGSFRARTLAEFDVADPSGVRDLARYYIFLTFGAEAHASLRDYGVHLSDGDILEAMADIMDEGYSLQKSRLDDQFRCDGKAALWSALSKQTFENGEAFNHEAILSAFSNLPLHLRQHLGPFLAEKYLQADDLKNAKIVQGTIDRAEGEHGDAFELLDAEFSMLEGDETVAEDTLSNLVREDGPLAPEALIRLIESHTRKNDKIERKYAELAEALAIEHRGTPLEKSLQRSAILASIYSGAPEKAFIKLQSADSASLDNTSDLWTQTLEKISADSRDLTFLNTVFKKTNLIAASGSSREAKIAVFDRLVGLGFSQKALEVLPVESLVEDPELKMRAAQALFDSNEFEEAAVLASSLETEQAKSVLAKIHFLEGNNRKAFEALANTNQAERDTFAFLSESWSALQTSEETAFAELAKTLHPPAPRSANVSSNPPTLEELRKIVNSSQKTREALRNVLSLTEPESGVQ